MSDTARRVNPRVLMTAHTLAFQIRDPRQQSAPSNSRLWLMD